MHFRTAFNRFLTVPTVALAGFFALTCGEAGGPTGTETPVPTSISLSSSNLTFEALEATEQLSPIVRDQNGAVMSGVSLTWVSSDATVAAVSISGLVTAKSNGSTTITGSIGSISAEASVFVAQTVRSVEIASATILLSGPGQSAGLAAEVKDGNGYPVSGQSAEWSSTDASVARIQGGEAVGVAYGAALLVARSGNYADTVPISVAKALVENQAATSLLPQNGRISFWVGGEGNHQIRLTAVGGNGLPLSGGSVTYAKVAGKVLLEVAGLQGDPGEYAPALIFGSPSFLSAASTLSAASSPAAGGPPAAVVGAIDLIDLPITVMTYQELAAEGKKAGDGLYDLGRTLWEPGPDEGRCLTFDDIADELQGTWLLHGAGLNARFNLRPASPGASGTTFHLLMEEFSGSGTEVLGSELARVTNGFLGLSPEFFSSDFVRVDLDLFDWTGPVPAFSFTDQVSAWMDPSDPLCSGLVPMAFVVVSAAQITGSTGGTTQVTVRTYSEYGRNLPLGKRGVPGVPVGFSLSGGTGGIRPGGSPAGSSFGPSTTVTTDEDGYARVEWQFGGTPGAQTLGASVAWQGYGYSLQQSRTVTAAVVENLGNELVFPSQRDGRWELYTVNADGSGLHRVTNAAGAYKYLPRWSPDGSKIAYLWRDQSIDYELRVTNPLGTASGTLDAGANVGAPRWAPSGDRLLFQRGRSSCQAYIVGTDGSGLGSVGPAGSCIGNWSPDGTKLALSTQLTKHAVVTNADGSGADSLGFGETPVWSPDGTQVLVSGTGNDLWVFPVEGPGTSTKLAATGFDPVFSPDGSSVLFWFAGEIWRLAYPNGTTPTNLTNHPANDRYPSWSPDGTRIAFLTDRDGNWEVYTMKADGSSLTNVSNHPASDGSVGQGQAAHWNPRPGG